MLIATGIMMIGLVMVATIFPVGVKLTALTTERTIGAVVADEAFAKIQLYGLRDFGDWPVANANTTCSDFQHVNDFDYDGSGTVDVSDVIPPDWPDFLYPSTPLPAGQPHNYHWSALCRRAGAKEVQVTVFVTRKMAAGAEFYGYDATLAPMKISPWPKPVKIAVDYDFANPKELVLDLADTVNMDWDGLSPAVPERVLGFIGDGYTIVDNHSGRIYHVLEVDRTNDTLILQQDWQPSPSSPDETIWVVPPAAGSSRYPCVGVYQKVIRFDDID